MLTGIVVGAALGIALIFVARRVRAEGRIYPAALILLSLTYVAFALSAREWDIALRELFLGAPFILGGTALLIFRTPISALATGMLWVVHAAFNIAHDRLLLNNGVPAWYPLLFATVEVVIGFYAIWLASTPPVGTAARSWAAAPTDPIRASAGLAVPAESAHR